jgi:hypothetical protein
MILAFLNRDCEFVLAASQNRIAFHKSNSGTGYPVVPFLGRWVADSGSKSPIRWRSHRVSGKMVDHLGYCSQPKIFFWKMILIDCSTNVAWGKIICRADFEIWGRVHPSASGDF